jgi:hypothetical protein
MDAITDSVSPHAVTYYSSILAWAIYFVGGSFTWPLPWAIRCDSNDAACMADPSKALPITSATSYFDRILGTSEDSLEVGVARRVSGPLMGSAFLVWTPAHCASETERRIWEHPVTCMLHLISLLYIGHVHHMLRLSRIRLSMIKAILSTVMAGKHTTFVAKYDYSIRRGHGRRHRNGRFASPPKLP